MSNVDINVDRRTDGWTDGLTDGRTENRTPISHPATSRCDKNYCPFKITQKDSFCLALYFKEKYFVLIDHVLSETICLFCFCVLFSNIYPKIKFTAKNWSDLCNFYGKKIFWNFYLLRKYFLVFFGDF